MRAGETQVTLNGLALGITLPAGIALREDDPNVTGEATTHEELADGFAAFQEPRPLTIPEHGLSWFLTAQAGEELPATRDEAIRMALQTDAGQPRPRVLVAEDLEGGGYLVTTHASDRLHVDAWRPNGTRPWHCGGEDFRDPHFVQPPSWLDDAQQVERARVALEAPCRTARVVR